MEVDGYSWKASKSPLEYVFPEDFLAVRWQCAGSVAFVMCEMPGIRKGETMETRYIFIQSPTR
jgi:hypothetical protein